MYAHHGNDLAYHLVIARSPPVLNFWFVELLSLTEAKFHLPGGRGARAKLQFEFSNQERVPTMNGMALLSPIMDLSI